MRSDKKCTREAGRALPMTEDEVQRILMECTYGDIQYFVGSSLAPTLCLQQGQQS